ncbi:MAG TPA: hydantoinase/oxoprolinase family protein [Gemmatimonadaceae bacterium]|nr:hydantoinase/oxoprolinase family protein [Gemmatimonadaceae bacterium]
MSGAVVGWDVGGVNVKVARVQDGRVLSAWSEPFELQRAPGRLTGVLAGLARAVGARPGDRHALTMTAELSQMFRTKREGVAFVLDAAVVALAPAPLGVFAVDGRFLAPDEARRQPLAVAAANWAATARVVAREVHDALLVDVGTTTADLIPIVGARVAALGRTDPERLLHGELVYTGAVRTPVEAIVTRVPLGDGEAGVSAEGFALAGDVHVWLGALAPDDYTAPTPDGRPATRAYAGERLARVVCADREMLDDAGIDRIAHAVAEAQAARVADAAARVRGHHPSIRSAVVTGLGDFVAARAATCAGLEVVRLGEWLGAEAARVAPAAAVALLAAEVRAVGRG